MRNISASTLSTISLAFCLCACSTASPGRYDGDGMASHQVESKEQPVVMKSAPAAPIRLELTGTTNGDDVDLNMVVDVFAELPVVPSIRFQLPDGAESVGRVLNRKLTELTGPGRYDSNYRLRNVKGPVVVTVEMLTDTFGFYAEAQWPPKEVPQVSVPREVPIPSTVVMGIPFDSAIPLEPDK